MPPTDVGGGRPVRSGGTWMKKTTTDRRLDRTNLRILEKLARAGRMSYSDLAEALDCSINTVRDRIFAMERRRVIEGYEAIVDESRLGRPVRAMVFLEPDSTMRRPHELREALQRPGIVRAELTTGAHALMVEMVASDMSALHQQIRTDLYPLGFRSARVVLLGPPPTALLEPDTEDTQVAHDTAVVEGRA